MNIRSAIGAAALMISVAGAAHALPITDVFTPVGAPVTLTTGNAYSYSHDLTAHGFDPLTDIIGSATLNLAISGPGGQPLTISLDGLVSFNDPLSALLDDQPLEIDFSYLQDDGILNVVLTKGGGKGSTFSFLGSTLFVQAAVPGGPDPAQVPAPAGLALLGIGLATIGAAFRRRRQTA